ncbi:beta strand repeat-containing protein [Frondihabitans australicus]|uniref:PKD repeat protein n=1 Tax=Frondihabitans australicus TaxID=386892 RepID=A0A495IA98_9MICO|nr:PKD domain-containing protein [Frondihabitans australicus]RKR72934.1 PKD repeat protein [Frondihabitans australicus]
MGKTLPSRIAAGVAAAALAFSALVAFSTPANAEGNPADPTNPATPATVTDDALSAPQIDGVVWSQKIVGNTVFAGGNFATARPAGSASGVNTVPRTDILSYNLTTGVLNTGFAPTLNGQVKTVAASADGSIIYIGGTFTTVNGVARSRLAALNATTGALITTFNPSPNYTVAAIAVSGSTVYFGGGFTSVGKSTRNRLASVNGTTGALTTWAPDAEGGAPTALAISPDGTKVVVGGAFTTLNGSSNPGYGLGEVDATSGALLPFAVNGLVRDAGTQSSILSLASDADGVYGSGYVYGAGGNLEGSFRATWDGGNITWIEDCHGDTYSVATTADAEYVAGHPHYCGNIGGFPQTSPTWTFHRGLAFSKAATQTITNDPYGYYNFAGNPAPSLQNWFPDFNVGTFTGQSQGPWSVATSADSNYVVYGGEFTTINGIQQQGLVRFAVKSIAPNKMGPKNSGANFVPSLVSTQAGSVRVSWTANWDPDSTNLTYNVYRNGDLTKPVYTTTQASNVYTTPQMGFVDTGLTPGATVSYRIRATDSDGNTVIGDGVNITVSNANPSAYSQTVAAQGATDYWPLNEASGTTVYDNAGFNDQVAGSGVTRGAAGSSSDGTTASTFDGSTSGYSAEQGSPTTGPQTFTEEAWFKTTTTAGGVILTFGDQNTQLSSNYDRRIYMTTDGKINFGVYDGNAEVLQSAGALNDGKWHQVVGSLSSAGMALYVDGKKVTTNANVTTAQNYKGYWRIGGDSAWSGANFFAGSIDNVSIYPTPLTAAQVNSQYVAAGYPSQLNSSPSDAYGSQVFTDSPVVYYRLGDAAGSTSAADSSLTNTPGVVSGGVTFGQPGAISGTSNTAAAFDGSSGQVASAQSFNDPEVYTEEAWFKTTTTTGGKIIGFGNAQTGQSSNYDRHIYMQDNGQLVFGVWTGSAQTITTPGAYNDGNWHYVAASQSSAGLALYVDGNLVGTNPTTQAQAYSGYWKIGGDTTWGSTSAYFKGTIDEAAVYDHALSASAIAAHYALGTGSSTNKAPTASFTSTAANLKESFDASASTDPDGTIASYAWNFGDGSTGTGVSPTHTYASAGTYTVTLTVTDNSGATGTATNQVTVAAPVNQAPTASFTSSMNNLQVAFDGTGSSDPDGTVASYAWNFGDGSTGTGSTVNHTYASAGTYSVKLTVTDNQGATGTATSSVTVVAPHVNQPPSAVITASTTGLKVSVDGTGSSDPDGTVASYAWNFGDGSTATGSTSSHTYLAGGTYTVTLTVTDNSGATGTATQSVTVAAPNQAPVASMTLGANALTLTADGSASQDPDGTIAAYSWNFGDNTAAATTKTATHTYAAAGTYTVTLTVTDNQGATGTSSQTVTVSKAPNVLPTASFTQSASNLKVSVDGTSSTDPDGTVQSYSWNFGDGTAAVTGATATHTYASAGTYKITLTVTDNDGGQGSSSQNATVTAPANQPPVASFTTTASGLALSADGSGSTDPDGTVASYSWNFGDGTAAVTGKTANHTYAAGGTYTVSLTVTDNGGATNTATQSVTVTAPAAQAFDLDSFSRTVSNGWGTADVGGAWTPTGSASVLSVANGAGVIATTKAGATNGVQLMGTTSTSTDLRAQFTLDKAASGGGTYVYISGRRVDSNNEYRATLRFSNSGQGVLSLTAISGGTATNLGSQVVMPGTITAGSSVSFRMQVSGTGTTSIKLKAWLTGTTEPSGWNISLTDSTPSLQKAGGIAIQSYVSASATTVPQNLSVQQLSALPVQ